jgi:predicted nicotinamide N-methyase
MSVSRGTYLGLFLISFAALTAEVALTRLFSFSIWYHFAYMTISVALLGYGASGSAYYAFPGLTRRGVEDALGRWGLAAALLLLLCLMIVSRVPLDPAELFPGGVFDWRAQPVQFLYLSLFYVAVTAPYFAAGLCITIIFSNAPGRIPQLYFADLVGAAAGCVAAVVLLTPLGAPGVIIFASACMALGAALFSWNLQRVRGAALTTVGLIVVFGIPLTYLADVKPSGKKILAQTMKNHDAEVLLSRWNPVYRADIVGGKEGSPIRIGRWTAWGVSDRFVGKPPENLVITNDGDAATMMYKFDGDFQKLEILDHSLLRLPYLLLDRPEVLVIGAGGGVDLMVALKNQARHVTGVELNPVTVAALKHDFAAYNGNVFNRPDVTLLVDEGRNFVARHQKKYDLIEITGIDTLAAIYSGAYVLSESYLYTVEALKEYFEHLTPGGMLCVVRGDLYFIDQPPRQILRFVSVTIEALNQMGVADPSRHIAVTLSKPRQAKLATFSVMVSRTAFDDAAMARLAAHAEQMGFQPWHLPGQSLNTSISQFVRMSDAERQRFLETQRLNYSPTTDDQPFFFNFLKWRTLLDRSSLKSDYVVASGQLVLAVILVQSVLFALLLIVAPLFRVGFTGGASRWRYLLYFACLGLGFIFIEISYIQRFALFLGSPVFSLSVILFTLLLSLGTGSYLSGQLGFLADTPRALLRLMAALIVLNVVYITLLPAIFNLFLGNALLVRICVAVLLLAPAGLIMGAFFPIGMRVVTATAPAVIPWMWAANGVASVVGSILCIVLAISIGFRAVNVVALAVYLLGITVMLGPARSAAAAREA